MKLIFAALLTAVSISAFADEYVRGLGRSPGQG